MKQTGQRPWEVFLLLYDAASGKFLDKKGPWESGTGFQLVPNSVGKFVIYLGPFYDRTHSLPGRLLLLSPWGEEIKRSVLDFGEDPRPGIRLLQSPSLRTILVIANWAGENHYRVLESESLETKSDWVEGSSKETPWLIGISDGQFLGMSNSSTFFVREFDSEWKTLAASTPIITYRPGGEFRPNAPFFLRDDTLVAPAYETKNDLIVPVLEKDGKVLWLSSTKRLPDYNFLRPAVTSPDGRYFGILLVHENRLTHWWNYTVDMGPAGASYFIYLWKAGSSIPPWRIERSPRLSGVCFFPPPAQAIALADSDRLKVFSLPNSGTPPDTSLP